MTFQFKIHIPGLGVLNIDGLGTILLNHYRDVAAMFGMNLMPSLA